MPLLREKSLTVTAHSPLCLRKPMRICPCRCRAQPFLRARGPVFADLQHQQESLRLPEHYPAVLRSRILKQNVSSIYFTVLWNPQHQIHGKVYTKHSEKSRKQSCVYTSVAALKSLFTCEKGGEGLLGDICWNRVRGEGLGCGVQHRCFNN